MILPLLGLLVALAIIFTVLSFFIQDLPAKILCLMLSIITWMSAAPASAVIQIPYQIENSTSGTAIEGVHSLAGIEPGLAWLFLGIGILMIIYGWYVLTRVGFRK